MCGGGFTKSIWLSKASHKANCLRASPLYITFKNPLPTRSSRPKTVFSPNAEQFHLPWRNWYWHSLIPIWAPSPITMKASGRL